jgi:hypothetical protein
MGTVRRRYAVLYRADPIGISFENINLDEDASEAGTILPRLGFGKSLDDVQRVIYEEFVHWFDPATAGSQERYRQIASEIRSRGRLAIAQGNGCPHVRYANRSSS